MNALQNAKYAIERAADRLDNGGQAGTHAQIAIAYALVALLNGWIKCRTVSIHRRNKLDSAHREVYEIWLTPCNNSEHRRRGSGSAASSFATALAPAGA